MLDVSSAGQAAKKDEKPFIKESTSEPGKFSISPVQSTKIIIPKKLSPQEKREFMRQEYKRLSKNLDQVQYENLDNESKYNYLICERLFTRPANSAAADQNDASHGKEYARLDHGSARLQR